MRVRLAANSAPIVSPEETKKVVEISGLPISMIRTKNDKAPARKRRTLFTRSSPSRAERSGVDAGLSVDGEGEIFMDVA